MLAREELGAERAAGLFIGDRKEGEVAPQREAVAVIQQQRDELHHRHALHVDRATAPDEAVAHRAAERIDRPVLALERDDVAVVEQDQRVAARPVARDGRGQRVASARPGVEAAVGDALAVENAREPRAGARLVAGRVDGVDTDVLGQQLGRLGGERVPVERRLRRHRAVRPWPVGAAGPR